jgi:hypothetical protein
MTPSAMPGVLNDALSIYVLDPTLASAFPVRWCAGYKVETAEGVFRAAGGAGARHITERSATVASRVLRLVGSSYKRTKINDGEHLWLFSVGLALLIGRCRRPGAMDRIEQPQLCERQGMGSAIERFPEQAAAVLQVSPLSPS